MKDLAVIQDVETEQAVLGGLLTEPEAAYPLVTGILNANDFFLEGHQLIFRAAQRLYGRNIMPDAMAVIDDLRTRNEIDRVGGSGYVVNLLGFVATASGVEAHSLLVKEKSRLRAAQRALLTGLDMIGSGEQGPDDVIAEVKRTLDIVADDATVDSDIEAADALALRAAGRNDNVWGYTTGLERVDEKTNGFTPGLWIWAARANAGKSRVGTFTACAAHRAGCKVGIISLDMRDELIEYIASTVASLHGRRLEWQYAKDDELRFVGDHLGGMRFVHEHCSTTAQVVRMMRRWSRFGVKLVMLDQFQCLREYQQALESKNPARGMIDSMLQALKTTALDLGMCLLGHHQINRDGVDKPSLANLKDSGGFEERASKVLLLHDPQRAILKAHTAFKKTERGMPAVPTKKDWENFERDRTGLHFEAEIVRPVVIDLAKNRGPLCTVVVNFNFQAGVVVP